MVNLDMKKKEYEELSAPVVDAAIGENADVEKFKSEFAKYSQMLAERVVKDASDVAEQLVEAKNDARRTDEILSSRGARVLTREEKEYFSALQTAMKDKSPNMALTNLDKTFPVTTINQVFEDLRQAHPILDAISFKNYGLVTEFIFSTASGVAGWGELCSPIVDELAADFDAYRVSLHKLSAYLPVCNAMLEIGPEWLERYVRELLYEAASVGLEEAIVDGDGLNKPIGMTRKISGDSGGVFPRKTAVPLNSLTPDAIAPILGGIAFKPNGKPRNFSEVIMVVNPVDYFSKVFPATTVRRTDGSYNTDVMPFPTRIIKSAAMPANHAVIGVAKDYDAGFAGAKGGTVEYSEHFKWLDDLTVFRMKLYATGRPKDETAFAYVDITDLKPALLQVEVKSEAVGP